MESGYNEAINDLKNSEILKDMKDAFIQSDNLFHMTARALRTLVFKPIFFF